MKSAIPITTLFVDIGGVLLTNGWDRHARRRAARNFNLKYAEIEGRHVLNFAAREEARVTFQEYLNRVVSCKKRLIELKQYIGKHGEDMPEIRNSKWSSPKSMSESL